MVWLGQIVELLTGLGMLGVGLALLRPVAAAAGWLLSAAGLLQLLSVCFISTLVVSDSMQGGMATAGWALAGLVDLTVFVLVAAALAVAARKLASHQSSGSGFHSTSADRQD